MTPPLRVRLAQPGDVARLFELRAGAIHARMFPGEDPDFLARTLTSPMGGRVLVAERDGRLVGYAALAEAPEPTCGLLEIVVAPFERRHGAGRALEEAARTLARLHDLSRVEVHTTPENGMASAFLTTVGYRDAGGTMGGGVAYRLELKESTRKPRA